jgi:transcriptional regulator with XRE-family HTH domain
VTDASVSVISWERISVNLSEGLGKGEGVRFSRLMGVSEELISQWRNFQKTPSLEKVLEVCYALELSPLQLMIDDSAAVREIILATGEAKPRQTRQHTLQRVDREYVKEYLQAVLDGREPCRSIHQIERHLGIGHRTLEKCFPLECSFIAIQYQTQRAQHWKRHITVACDEVRREALGLFAQGIKPSVRRVRARLSSCFALRRFSQT